jgi:CheY-like chemotaxis protein
MARILVIAGDQDTRLLACSTLQAAGHEIVLAADGAGTAELCTPGPALVDLVLVELFMSQVDGYELIRHFQATSPQTRCIAMCEGLRAAAYLRLASRLGAASVLKKPFSADELLAAVAAAITNPTLL